MLAKNCEISGSAIWVLLYRTFVSGTSTVQPKAKVGFAPFSPLPTDRATIRSSGRVILRRLSTMRCVGRPHKLLEEEVSLSVANQANRNSGIC